VNNAWNVVVRWTRQAQSYIHQRSIHHLSHGRPAYHRRGFPGMDTALIVYHGDLRTDATHVRSGTAITTDAPVDNHGKGSAFSPTDLLCVSLATCMLTTMGISAQAKAIPFRRATARVVKHMASDPRRVARVEVHIGVDGSELGPKERILLERIAETCPVARSLHPDIVQEMTFTYA
jgi:putative redox protein